MAGHASFVPAKRGGCSRGAAVLLRQHWREGDGDMVWGGSAGSALSRAPGPWLLPGSGLGPDWGPDWAPTGPRPGHKAGSVRERAWKIWQRPTLPRLETKYHRR